MRCFIALDLPKEITSELTKLQEEIKKKDLFNGKYVEPNNIHLTLKFLGKITKDQIRDIQKKLKTINVNSFESIVDEVGVFSEEFVRIIWIRLNGKEVFELQRKVDDLLQNLFPKENRFMSHVTIARVKDKVEDRKALIEYLKSLKINVKGKITSFSLIKSELKPEGPVYEVIEKYLLS